MKTPIISMIGILTCSLAAFANSGTRGGGNAIVCFDTPNIPKEIRAKDAFGNIIDGSIKDEYIQHITKVEMLDLYQAQVKKGMNGQPSQLIEPKANESFEQYAKRILSRVKGLETWLESALETIKELPADRAEMYSYGIEPVNDYNIDYRIDTTNCVVGTVALNTREGDVYRLAIDERLMLHPKHSRLSQYVTYLHEVIYRTGKDLSNGYYEEPNFKDAVRTRQIVAALLKKETTIGEIMNLLDEGGEYGDLDFLRNTYLTSVSGHYTNYDINKGFDDRGTALYHYLLGTGEAKKYVTYESLQYEIDLGAILTKNFPIYKDLDTEIKILKENFERLSEDEKNEFYALGESLNNADWLQKRDIDDIFKHLEKIFEKAKESRAVKAGLLSSKQKKVLIAQIAKLNKFVVDNEKAIDLENIKRKIIRLIEKDYLKGILYSINNTFKDKNNKEVATIKSVVMKSDRLNQSEKVQLLENMSRAVQNFIAENKTLNLKFGFYINIGTHLIETDEFTELKEVIPQLDRNKQLPVK